jgi:hypothetical protein
LFTKDLEAVKVAHPDKGGTDAAFRVVNEASSTA